LSREDGGDRHGIIRYAVAVAAALFVLGVVALTFGLRGSGGPPAPAAARPAAEVTTMPPPGAATPTTTATAPGSASGTTTTRPSPSAPPEPAFGQILAGSAPTKIDIASIGLHSTNFVNLSVAADGTLTVPGSADEVGLYDGGPTPGQLGPAVLGAHVDSKEGPGIFYRLGSVRPGDQINIGRADGSMTTFTVDRVASYPKDQFPTDLVYHGDFTRSELRLVTCGGTFDKVKHYLDNVIVFAHLTQAT